MKKYQYLVRYIEFVTGENELDYLNDRGLEGWELVSVCPQCGGAGHYFYFKKKR